MARYLVTAKYGTTTLFSGLNVGASAAVAYNGSTILTINATGTKTLSCKDKMMKTNVTVGGKTLNCANKIMSNDVVFTTTQWSNRLFGSGTNVGFGGCPVYGGSQPTFSVNSAKTQITYDVKAINSWVHGFCTSSKVSLTKGDVITFAGSATNYKNCKYFLSNSRTIHKSSDGTEEANIVQSVTGPGTTTLTVSTTGSYYVGMLAKHNPDKVDHMIMYMTSCVVT